VNFSEDMPTIEEMGRIINRDQFALNMMASKLGDALRENAVLMSIIDELQGSLAERDHLLQELQQSAGVESAHGDVHAIPHDQPVPSG
jgi:hypothetical protein